MVYVNETTIVPEECDSIMSKALERLTKEKCRSLTNMDYTVPV